MWQGGQYNVRLSIFHVGIVDCVRLYTTNSLYGCMFKCRHRIVERELLYIDFRHNMRPVGVLLYGAFP